MLRYLVLGPAAVGLVRDGHANVAQDDIAWVSTFSFCPLQPRREERRLLCWCIDIPISHQDPRLCSSSSAHCTKMFSRSVICPFDNVESSSDVRPTDHICCCVTTLPESCIPNPSLYPLVQSGETKDSRTWLFDHVRS
ncbi:hypothetical protein K439DRAFT_802264 [Ramaria rubella]|nr:hypothetical protein K439DRAFT_802264 [Ramaria rubella]